VHELGGAAIVQDPASAERYEMPRAAVRAVPDAHVLPLEEIPGLLTALCGTAKVAPV
jgi:chemotaxis response regulator CheB